MKESCTHLSDLCKKLTVETIRLYRRRFAQRFQISFNNTTTLQYLKHNNT